MNRRCASGVEAELSGLIAAIIGGLVGSVVIALLAGVLSAANDTFAERCDDLHGNWPDMCNSMIQTSEWGMDAIGATSDLRALAGQAKQKP